MRSWPPEVKHLVHSLAFAIHEVYSEAGSNLAKYDCYGSLIASAFLARILVREGWRFTDGAAVPRCPNGNTICLTLSRTSGVRSEENSNDPPRTTLTSCERLPSETSAGEGVGETELLGARSQCEDEQVEWQSWGWCGVTPRSVSALTVSGMCNVLRPSRSNFHATMVSPSRTYSISAARPGRSSRAPDMVSENIFITPAASRAAFC
jgi:hypothetical protein